MDALWTILVGALFAISCGLLGAFLILRRMAMVGDAISHAVLPGIVIAYLLTGSRDSAVMIAGASAIGILTTVLIEFLHGKARLQNDAAIGVTFTWMFALGIILISVFAGRVDLDQECVLYGEIAYVPLDLVVTGAGQTLGPVALWVAGAVLALNLVLLAAGYRRLALTTFDPSFAAAAGLSVGLWHYLLMGAVSMTTVAAFESVGAILVIALLVVPPATAYLLTQRLERMLGWTVVFAITTSAGGYGLARLLDASIAGSMATVTGVQFALAFWLARWRRLRAARADHPAAADAGGPG